MFCVPLCLARCVNNLKILKMNETKQNSDSVKGYGWMASVGILVGIILAAIALGLVLERMFF